MDTFKIIERKIEAFIKKYYTNELLKGVILFFAFGALYFLITLLIEYFLWLRPAARTVLFWVFVVVELILLFKFIAIPAARLFKLSKGINYAEAAQIIGEYFPEVKDKLLNTLQLHKEAGNSELMLASVAQKSASLKPIPFKLAIDFKKNAKYLKYALIPIVLFLIANYGGREEVFSSSYKRVVNYSEAYEPPAPFEFFVMNESLKGIENKDYKLQIRTTGDIVPEEVSIHFNNETYFLQQTRPGEFSFVFEQPVTDIPFYVSANKVTSKGYTLQILEVPSLVNFNMQLDYPNYIHKITEHIKNTGNAIIPEGTKVTWVMDTKKTDAVEMVLKDTVYAFAKVKPESFKLSKRLYSNTAYEVSASNAALRNYESIAYAIQVVKDQYPVIDLEARKDTISEQQIYFYGRVSDDYGLSRLRLTYYEDGSNTKQYKEISIKNANVDQFVYAFPDALQLQEGKTYEYYFEVFDNDVLHNYKSTKSSVFSYAKLTQSDLEQEQLQKQKESISNLDKALVKIDQQERDLQELSKSQKEKEQLNYNDHKKLQDFLKRQKRQEKIMQDFSKQLKENLDQFQKDEPQTDEDKERLKERLERLEKKAKENEKLLEELEKLREKLGKEELTEKLENLENKNKNNKRNLEQMLELTKRFYVEKKAEKISRDLENLADKQEDLSNREGAENTKEAQDMLNEQFEKLEKELEQLEKENNDLKKPMEIPADPKRQEEIKEQQQGASQELDQQEQQQQDKQSSKNTSEAQKKQKKAAQKMKQMSQSMEQGMQASGQESMEEDAEMLRQILDNLLVFSLEEEDLMLDFKTISDKNPLYAQKLRRQNVLKQNFEHVDDSLYALSLRVPELDETINESLVKISYNLDKSLDRLAEPKLSQGVSSQQYVVTGANELADMLSGSLDQMQQSMGQGQGSGKSQGKGEGQGKGGQLPDLIQSQEDLNKKMQEGNSPSQGDKGDGEGQSESQGEGGDQGKGGSDSGNKNVEGNNGGDKNGDGKNGEGDKNGEGSNEDEYEQGLLYDIYKEQQELRKQLEDAIEKEGIGDKGDKLVKDMKAVEQQLLDKGFSNETMERMSALKHELLKLKEATIQQGKEDKREGVTNLKEYQNPNNAPLDKAKKYFNNTEILNRATLLFKGKYKKKVQEYFQGYND